MSSSVQQTNVYNMEGPREHGYGNIDLSHMQTPTNLSFQLYPPQTTTTQFKEFPPHTTNDNTPLIGVPSPTPILSPNILGSIFFGLVVLSTFLSLYYYNRYVLDINTILKTYSLSYIAVVHVVAFLVLLPGFAFICCCRKTGERKTFLLPWALVGEILFVGYFCLVWFLSHRTCNNNLCGITFSLHPILISLLSLPWALERIDIAGSVAAVVMSTASFLFLTSSDNGWDWSNYLSDWPTLLVSFGMAFVFALFVIILRKSTSHPTTGHFQVLFVHVTVGMILSVGIALALEFHDLSNWLDLFKNWDVDMIWKLFCFVAIGVAYKISLVLSSRFSDTHTSGFFIHLGVVHGAAVSILVSSISFPLLDWIKNNPKLTAAFVLFQLSELYLIVRILMLRCMYKRKLKNVEDEDGVLLEIYRTE